MTEIAEDATVLAVIRATVAGQAHDAAGNLLNPDGSVAVVEESN